MMKNLFFILYLCFCPFFTYVSMADDVEYDDSVSFDSFISETENDVRMESVSLNPDSDVVDVKHFDIAGIMLGMNYDEIYNLFFNGHGLYAPRKKNSIVYSLNKEWKYNLDYECRQNNIFIPEKLEKCIYSLAKNRGLLYVSEIHLERTFTGETIDVYFTSNATDNLVWKVVYKNDVDTIEGGGEKFQNQREKKILSFWQGVIDKYGMPNSGEDKWISSEIAYEPMMQVFYGQLVLQDQGLNTSDSSENIKKARENFQAKPYAF